MADSPNIIPRFTQRLSQEIDVAYDAYVAQQPDSERRLYEAFLRQAQNVVFFSFVRFGFEDDALAREITHRAFNALQTFDNQSRISTWFWTIARREVNRALRARIRAEEQEVPVEVDEDGNDTPALPAHPAHTILETRIDLDRSLRGLPPEQAEVMKLKQEGHTLTEISEITGDPIGTVRSRYRLAKAKGQKKTRKRK